MHDREFAPVASERKEFYGLFDKCPVLGHGCSLLLSCLRHASLVYSFKQQQLSTACDKFSFVPLVSIFVAPIDPVRELAVITIRKASCSIG